MSTWQKVLLAVLSAGVAAAAIWVKNPRSQATVQKIEESAAPVIGALGAD